MGTSSCPSCGSDEMRSKPVTVDKTHPAQSSPLRRPALFVWCFACGYWDLNTDRGESYNAQV